MFLGWGWGWGWGGKNEKKKKELAKLQDDFIANLVVSFSKKFMLHKGFEFRFKCHFGLIIGIGYYGAPFWNYTLNMYIYISAQFHYI